MSEGRLANWFPIEIDHESCSSGKKARGNKQSWALPTTREFKQFMAVYVAINKSESDSNEKKAQASKKASREDFHSKHIWSSKQASNKTSLKEEFSLVTWHLVGFPKEFFLLESLATTTTTFNLCTKIFAMWSSIDQICEKKANVWQETVKEAQKIFFFSFV